jgi:hypothetical protein
VLKRHAKNIRGVKLDMIFFFFGAIGGTKMLKVEGVGYNVEGHQEMHRGCFKE